MKTYLGALEFAPTDYEENEKVRESLGELSYSQGTCVVMVALVDTTYKTNIL